MEKIGKPIRVFKFGGMCTASGENIKKVLSILKKYREHKLIIVFSAKGKTTDNLYEVLRLWRSNDPAWERKLSEIVQGHSNLAKKVSSVYPRNTIAKFDDYYHAILSILSDKRNMQTNAVAKNILSAKIVSYGEQYATTLMYELIKGEIRKTPLVISARECIVTDEVVMDAQIYENDTQRAIQQRLVANQAWGEMHPWVITEGFIATTKSGHTSLLGREGSDYSAGIFGAFTHAESVTLWKTVDGVFSSDPNSTSGAQLYRELTYDKASALHAKVIHPKTITLLKKYNIPLIVKSIHKPDEVGTIITA